MRLYKNDFANSSDFQNIVSGFLELEPYWLGLHKFHTWKGFGTGNGVACRHIQEFIRLLEKDFAGVKLTLTKRIVN